MNLAPTAGRLASCTVTMAAHACWRPAVLCIVLTVEPALPARPAAVQDRSWCAAGLPCSAVAALVVRAHRPLDAPPTPGTPGPQGGPWCWPPAWIALTAPARWLLDLVRPPGVAAAGPGRPTGRRAPSSRAAAASARPARITMPLRKRGRSLITGGGVLPAALFWPGPACPRPIAAAAPSRIWPGAGQAYFPEPRVGPVPAPGTGTSCPKAATP